MTIKITKSKTKAALADKTKARKKLLVHKTSVAAMANATADSLLPTMKLERRKLFELKGLKRRVRKSEKEQVERVAKSLKTFEQCVPVLISSDGEIIAGHVVAEALKSLGEKEVWCVVVDHLDEHQREMLHVALNRIAECGDWDVEALGELLVDLGELGFDLETTGFTLPELDIIMSPEDQEADESDEDLTPPADPVSVVGDLWQLGPHRVLCGDATNAESYKIVLAGELAHFIIADGPWNIPIKGFVSGLGKKKHEDFVAGVGEWSPEEFLQFSETYHSLGAANLRTGGVFISWIDWRSVDVIMAGGRKAGLRHINTAVWNKGSGGMGTPYRSSHEFGIIFCNGPKLAVNNVQLGKNGRDRTNVWTYPGANRRGTSAAKALASHPTPKNVEMIVDAIKDVTDREAVVLDPFLGSGTTLVAAENSGRRACGIELDPGYVDVAIRRWEQLTGKQAVQANSGLTFEEVRLERAVPDQKNAA